MRSLLSKLQQQTLIFDCINEVSAAPQFDDKQIQSTWIDAHTFEVTMPASHDINALFAALPDQGVRVKGMRNKSNRLEELFLSRLQHGRESQAQTESVSEEQKRLNKKEGADV